MSSDTIEKPNLKRQKIVGDGEEYLCLNDQDGYFSSYEGIDVHEDMIKDFSRTNTYRLAIQKYKSYIEGKVVLDVGAGTGILSVFCAQAGAKKVYAVEGSKIAELAQEVIRENNVHNVVTIINEKMEHVELPEKVDVIVSEWMGYFLVYESMLESVIIARDRWLKEDGIMLPEKASMFIAPITNDEFFSERLDFWKTEPKKMYGIDMSCMMRLAKNCKLSKVYSIGLEAENMLGFGKKFWVINCYTITKEQLRKKKANFELKCIGDGNLCGLCCWFDVIFWERESKNNVSIKPLTLSTSPDHEPTHWDQTVFYFDDQYTIKQDECFSGNIAISTNTINTRCIDVSFEVTLKNNVIIKKDFQCNSDSV